jgi:hypothetical protein
MYDTEYLRSHGLRSSSWTKPITDYCINYDARTDTVSCSALHNDLSVIYDDVPVSCTSYESVPFDESVIHTCCWYAFKASTSNVVRRRQDAKCPFCYHSPPLVSYVTLNIVRSDMPPYHYKDGEFTLKLGVDLNWNIEKVGSKIEKHLGYSVVRLWPPMGRAINKSDVRTLRNHGIESGHVLNVSISCNLKSMSR